MLDFLLITLVILLITKWYQSKPFIWKDAGIPYSIPWPVVGSAASALGKPLHQYWRDMYSYMGDNPAYGYHFFGRPALVLRDPNLVKQFTTTNSDHFMSHGFHSEESYDPLGKGIFFADGEQWRESRAKMTPYFTPSRIKGMIPMIHPISDKYVEYISTQGKTGPVDVNDASMRLAVDIVVSTVFGLQPDSFDNADSFFFNIQKEMVSFTFGLKTMLGVMSPTLYRFFGLTLFSWETTRKLKQFINDVLDQRLGGVGNRPDFVQGMVELMQKDKFKDNDKIKYNADGTIAAKFDRFSVIGQCMLMYAAGTETTGNSLTFLLYELALNQDVQDKARREIISMIERTKGEYGFDELHELKYISMVMNETLRKYPVVAGYGRKCTKKFDFNGIEMPVGTMVMITPIGIHYDPKYFQDPEKFLPERFSDDTNITPGSFIPFGMGPRTCIGMKFSQTEMALALCKLLPKHRLTVSSKTDVPVKFSSSPTLSTKNGMWLNVEEIK